MLKHKSTNYQTQKERLKRAFSKHPKTMLQVARKTGIERAYICYRLAELQEKNQVIFVGYGICPISKHRAGLYLTRGKNFTHEK